MKRNRPVAVCTRCGAMVRAPERTNQQCGRSVGGIRCAGAYRSALRPDDFDECTTCFGTANIKGVGCNHCGGEGWLYVRRP